MDSFEFNKFAGAILFTLLVTLGVGIVAEELFHPHQPEKPGYEVAVVEDAGEAEAEVEEVVEIPVLLASADIEAGEKVSKKCLACHTFEDGGANKVGPALYGIVGRQIASHEGFAYSDAMKEHANADGDTWTYENLYHFVENPKAFMPGTKMAFAGVRKPEDLADLLAYLQSLADSPVPFPEVAEVSTDDAAAEQPTAEQPAAEDPAPEESASEEPADAPAEGGEPQQTQ